MQSPTHLQPFPIHACCFDYSHQQRTAEEDYISSNTSGIIYPNPSDGSTVNERYQFVESKQVILCVYNNLGQEIYRTSTADNKTDFSASLQFLHPLPKGIYLVKATNGSESFTHKLIIQ